MITGAASGFGAGMARLFAAEGAAVLIGDLDGEKARKVVAEIADLGGRADSLVCDVSRRDDVAAMVSKAQDEFGSLDILVNNAGISHQNKPYQEVTDEEFDRIYAVNVKGVHMAIQSALPLFEAAGGGVILNISSTAALRPRPGLSVYNSSKGAVQILSKSLAAELAPLKVRVNAICPVMGDTGLLETFMGQADTPENREKFIGGIPLGRLSTPEDIARAALFLVSDQAAFITGVALEVDGGRCV